MLELWKHQFSIIDHFEKIIGVKSVCNFLKASIEEFSSQYNI